MLRRLDRVVVNGFDVHKNKDIALSSDDNYFIYMKNARFKANGDIVGFYLGEASDNLIDGYCRDAIYNDGAWANEDGVELKRAGMIAIKNDGDKKVVIVIQ